MMDYKKEKKTQKEIMDQIYMQLKLCDFVPSVVAERIGCSAQNVRDKMKVMKTMEKYEFPEPDYTCSCMATNEERMRYYNNR